MFVRGCTALRLATVGQVPKIAVEAPLLEAQVEGRETTAQIRVCETTLDANWWEGRLTRVPAANDVDGYAAAGSPRCETGSRQPVSNSARRRTSGCLRRNLSAPATANARACLDARAWSSTLVCPGGQEYKTL